MAERARGCGDAEAALKGYMAFALENADEYELTFMVTHASLKHQRRRISIARRRSSRSRSRSFLAFRDQVAKLIADGVLRPADATVMTQMLWGALHGLATLLITHPTFPWADHRLVIDTLVDTLVRGLKAPLDRLGVQ